MILTDEERLHIAHDLHISMLHSASSNIDPTDDKRILERQNWLICESFRRIEREVAERCANEADKLPYGYRCAKAIRAMIEPEPKEPK